VLQAAAHIKTTIVAKRTKHRFVDVLRPIIGLPSRRLRL
jgi:hypothetical protein